MGAKQKIKHGINNILIHNRDGSFQTQGTRKRALLQMIDDLSHLGFKLAHVQGLKQKHILALNEHWQEQNLTTATIKNRNSYLRWLCQKIGKTNLMPSNDQLGVAKRQHVAQDKSTHFDLATIEDQRLRIILNLQKHFGLRREEALKFQPHFADHGSSIVLKPTWCKGGRGRHVPVTSDEARHWLNEAKTLCAATTQSMIPTEQSYKQYMEYYAKTLFRLGIRGHGLRHYYAQQRYQELTGWLPPAKGGPTKSQLTASQISLDYKIRLQISEELGHSRINITKIYL